MNFFDAKTKILTDKGWKKLIDINECELVANWYNNFKIEFSPIKKKEVIERKEVYNLGLKYTHFYFDLDNDLFYFVKEEKRTQKIEEKLPNHFKIPVSGVSVGNKVVLSDEEKLRLIYLCNERKINENDNTAYNTKFVFKKKKQFDRARKLLKENSIQFDIFVMNDEKEIFVIYTNKRDDWDKELNWLEYDKIDYRYVHNFIKELTYWGLLKKVGKKYYSRTKYTLFLQNLSALCSLGKHYVKTREKDDFYEFEINRNFVRKSGVSKKYKKEFDESIKMVGIENDSGFAIFKTYTNEVFVMKV